MFLRSVCYADGMPLTEKAFLLSKFFLHIHLFIKGTIISREIHWSSLQILVKIANAEAGQNQFCSHHFIKVTQV